MPYKQKAVPFWRAGGFGALQRIGVLALEDSRFLLCDNNVSDALMEFHSHGAGREAFIFATSSLCLKTRKGHHKKKRKRGTARGRTGRAASPSRRVRRML